MLPFMKILGVALMLCSMVSAALCGGKASLTPTRGKPISVIANGKAKKYYVVTKSETVELQAEGPSKLDVFTRLSIQPDENGPQQYTITVKQGQAVVKEYTTSSEKSSATYENSGYIPAKSRKFTLLVPAGNHTYTFSLTQTNHAEVALRFTMNVGKKGIAAGGTITLEPMSYDRVATEVASEKLITYYVSSARKEVELRVVGPTTLTIAARLNFDAKMQGEQKFAVAVYEKDQRVSLESFTATKALDAMYKDWEEVVPGKLNSMVFTVPTGEHTYRFSLENSSARSISLKFSIPEKDLKNED